MTSAGVSEADHPGTPEPEPDAAPALTRLEALGAVSLEPLGDEAVGYCADGVCFLPGERTGPADADLA